MRRLWALPFVPLYWAGLRLKHALRKRSSQPPHTLRRPVISVGSLSAGGAGKTPLVLMLAEIYKRHGIDADILSRGYRRQSKQVEEVPASGDPARFGDEPILLARHGLRVFVGADRFAAGTLAEAGERNEGVQLLDDGFQHQQLARDLNVVLLTLEDARDWHLPAGNLREPLAALARADVIVLREDEASALSKVVATHSQAEVWVTRRQLVLPAEMPHRPLLFCGIARPQTFLKMVREAGCEPAANSFFPDHHAYTLPDIARLVDKARRARADGFCTTAKDAVKISPEARKTLETIGPLIVAQLRVSLINEPKATSRLLSLWTASGKWTRAAAAPLPPP